MADDAERKLVDAMLAVAGDLFPRIVDLLPGGHPQVGKVVFALGYLAGSLSTLKAGPPSAMALSGEMLRQAWPLQGGRPNDGG